jgi:hypothetical protein
MGETGDRGGGVESLAGLIFPNRVGTIACNAGGKLNFMEVKKEVQSAYIEAVEASK